MQTIDGDVSRTVLTIKQNKYMLRVSKKMEHSEIFHCWIYHGAYQIKHSFLY